MECGYSAALAVKLSFGENIKRKLDNSFPTVQSISAGVLQGSLIVPILFNLFINYVFQFNTNNTEFCLYADDTIILSADTDIELQSLVDAFFLKYTVWCLLINNIVINPTKSNFLLFNLSNITANINGNFL